MCDHSYHDNFVISRNMCNHSYHVNFVLFPGICVITVTMVILLFAGHIRPVCGAATRSGRDDKRRSLRVKRHQVRARLHGHGLSQFCQSTREAENSPHHVCQVPQTGRGGETIESESESYVMLIKSESESCVR